MIANAENQVAGCATLSMTGIDHSRAPVALTENAPDPVPAMLVGRLAVDRRSAGLGIGTVLVERVLVTAVNLDSHAACRAVGPR